MFFQTAFELLTLHFYFYFFLNMGCYEWKLLGKFIKDKMKC